MQVNADDRPDTGVKDDDLEVVVDDESAEPPASDEGAGADATGSEGADRQSQAGQDGPPSSTGEDEQAQQKESRAQKRIRQLVQEANEAKRIANQVVSENQQLRQRYQRADSAAAEHFGKNLETRLQQAREQWRRAMEEGDYETAQKADEEIADAKAEYKDYQRWKARQQQAQQRQTQQPAQQPAQQPQQPQQPPRGADKAQQWAAKHEWFGDTSTPQGQAMTATAYSLDAQLQQEGFDPTEDDHWQELDRRMAQAFPDRLGGQRQGASEQTANGGQAPQQPVAGVSRSSPGQSQRRSRQVRLSAGEKRMADKVLSQLPKEQRYKEYARWKQKQEEA